MKNKKVPCSSVIFDCDGVIFDSNELKVDAFRKTLSDYPLDIVEAFISYHKTNAGISRYVKFRAFLTKFMKKPFNSKEYEILLSVYGQACYQLYQQAVLSPGCMSILKTLSNHIPLYVASGSDESELQKVFQQRNLNVFFEKIFGSPKNKTECVQAVLNDLGQTTKNVVMVGDAESDWQAAQQADATFIFMSRFSEKRSTMQILANTQGFEVIDTLEFLQEHIVLESSKL